MGFVVAVSVLLACAAMSSSPAEASSTSASQVTSQDAPATRAPDNDVESDGVSQTPQNTTKCGGVKHACGIKGVYVCCDGETECCKRKHGRTICEKKKNDKC
jgi:hypothetical protein